MLYYYDYESPMVLTNQYASLITYYDPEQTVEEFMLSLSRFYLPKFKRNQEKLQARVEKVHYAIVKRILHPEFTSIKKEDEKEKEGDEEKEIPLPHRGN